MKKQLMKMMRFLSRKKESTTYFTSDLHFGHFNVINYCNRPYKNIDEMTKDLIKIWNETVNDGDTVYVLGDFSLNKKWSAQIVPLLKGNKILVSGNHDYTFKHNPKKTSGLSIQEHDERYKRRCNEYIQYGWKGVHQELSLKLKDGTNVLLHHLPYATKKEVGYDQRYLDLRPKDEGMILLHGHLHGRYKKFNNMIDVGFDVWNKPVSEDEILNLINRPKSFIPSPLTEWYKNIKEKEDMKGR